MYKLRSLGFKNPNNLLFVNSNIEGMAVQT